MIHHLIRLLIFNVFSRLFYFVVLQCFNTVGWFGDRKIFGLQKYLAPAIANGSSLGYFGFLEI